jgi:hypothetical protein
MRRRPDSVVFTIAVHELALPSKVMTLAMDIVALHPPASSIVLRIGNGSNSSRLVGDPDFRKFATLLNQALPAWAYFLSGESNMPVLLFLASLPSIQIIERAGSDSVSFAFKRDEVDQLLNNITAAVVSAFPHDNCAWVRSFFGDQGIG